MNKQPFADALILDVEECPTPAKDLPQASIGGDLAVFQQGHPDDGVAVFEDFLDNQALGGVLGGKGTEGDQRARMMYIMFTLRGLDSLPPEPPICWPAVSVGVPV